MSDFTRAELYTILSALAMLSNKQEEIAATNSLKTETKERFEKAAFETRSLGCKVEDLITSAPRDYRTYGED